MAGYLLISFTRGGELQNEWSQSQVICPAGMLGQLTTGAGLAPVVYVEKGGSDEKTR